MICAHTQTETKTAKDIVEENMLATSPNQVGQLGCIPLPVHYFFCLFNKHVKE